MEAHGENEAFGHGSSPAFHGSLVRKLVEGIVDFGEVEDFGVRLQRRLFRDFEVCPTAGSNEVLGQNTAHSAVTLAGQVD